MRGLVLHNPAPASPQNLRYQVMAISPPHHLCGNPGSCAGSGVQGSGLEGTVGAEIGDQRRGAKVRSAREAQILLVVTGLEQEIESAVAIDIGILRLPGRKAAAEVPPIRCGSKAAAGRLRHKEVVVVRL